MNGYNFTERVRKVLQVAREEAMELRHEYVGTEHLLLGLLSGGGVAEATLVNLSVDLGAVRATVLGTVKPGTPGGSDPGILAAIADTIGLHRDRDLPYTSRAKKVLELAMQEARELKHSYVGTEHLLLGLMREEKGIGAQVLAATGMTLSGVRDEVIRLLGAELSSTESMPSIGHGPRDSQATITLIVEHSDGRIEKRKFGTKADAVRFLNELESQ